MNDEWRKHAYLSKCRECGVTYLPFELQLHDDGYFTTDYVKIPPRYWAQFGNGKIARDTWHSTPVIECEYRCLNGHVWTDFHDAHHSSSSHNPGCNDGCSITESDSLCERCGRPLSSSLSVEAKHGPICARHRLVDIQEI